MLLFTKIIHVLMLGLWFGTVVFFTFVVGLSLFGTFESLSEKPAGERPFWFPLPPELEKAPPSSRFPDPLRKEQGSRIAGVAVSPIFTWFFGIQLACGAVALITALAWLSFGGVHTVRVVVLVLALVGTAIGWWMEHKVSDLRQLRNDTSDVVLMEAQPSPEAVRVADEARAEFGKWHGYSLIVNFITLVLVTATMAMTAVLPSTHSSPHSASLNWIPAVGKPSQPGQLTADG